MKKINLFLVILISFGLVLPVAVQAEDGFWGWLIKLNRKNEVRMVENEQYKEECGSCHFPYQPGLLPERSWLKLLEATSLEDHFGDNAEMDESLRKPIEAFLSENAADKSHYKRSKKIVASLKAEETPLRISEVRYIQRKHRSMTDEYVKNNRYVKSLAQCDKCHQMADKAVYDDDTVMIPGFGSWTW